MINYLIRRLLLLIPTLFGITLLVFMIVAAAPGGIGAGARQAGGNMDPTSAAMRQAAIEDRYGLDDHILVQYGRWLRAISPIKFGARSLVDEAGDAIRPPRAMKDPPMAEWYRQGAGDASPAQAQPFAWPADATAESKRQAWRRMQQDYQRARVRALGSSREVATAIGEYARAAGLGNVLSTAGRVRTAMLAGHEPQRNLAQWQGVQQAGSRALSELAQEQEMRARLLAMLQAEPYADRAGLPLIPGAVWIGWPDLGRSFSRNRAVTALIGAALPVTLMLNIVAFVIIYAVAVPSGVLAAARRGTWVDVGLGASYIALWSFPLPLAGVLLLGFVASKEYLGLFPVGGLHDVMADRMTFLPTMERQADGSLQWTRGWLLDLAWHLCLPVMCLVYAGFAVLSKQTRAAMLDNFNADYVRTAKAKGVAQIDITISHVLRNSLLPLITLFVSIFPATFSGSVVIEQIFNVPGMGRLLLDGINQRDRELILATTLIVAGVNLLALLLADILYALADPRIAYS